MVLVTWQDAFGRVSSREALKVEDKGNDRLGREHYLVWWDGGGTSHFTSEDNLKINEL